MRACHPNLSSCTICILLVLHHPNLLGTYTHAYQATTEKKKLRKSTHTNSFSVALFFLPWEHASWILIRSHSRDTCELVTCFGVEWKIGTMQCSESNKTPTYLCSLHANTHGYVLTTHRTYINKLVSRKKKCFEAV